MSAKKFSAAAGILLLICAVVGIFIVIYGTETHSSSPSSSSPSSSSAGRRIEESLTVLHDWPPPKAIPRNESEGHHGSRFGKKTTKEQRKIETTSNTNANTNGNIEMDKMSLSNHPLKKPGLKDIHPRIMTTPVMIATTGKPPPRKSHERNNNNNNNGNGNSGGGGAFIDSRPKILGMEVVAKRPSSVHQSLETTTKSPTRTVTTTSQMNFPPSPWSPVTEPSSVNVNLRVPLNQGILAPGESLRTSFDNGHGDDDDKPPRTNRPRPYLNSPSHPHPNPPHENLNLLKKYKYSSLEKTGESELELESELEPEKQHQQHQGSEEISEEDQHYTLHSEDMEEIEDEQEPQGEEPGGEEEEEEGGEGFHFGQLFDLATHLYASGTNASDVQSFLKIINETVNKGNNSGLLTQLNELYSRRDVSEDDVSSFKSSSSANAALLGRNTFETSLTAFVFMSFGVFLLNQIHNFVGKENGRGRGRSQQGRNFFGNSLMDGPEESNLEILFKSPYLPHNLNAASNSNSNSSWTEWYEQELEKERQNQNQRRRDESTFENNTSTTPDKQSEHTESQSSSSSSSSQRQSNNQDLINSGASSSSISSTSTSTSSSYVNDMFRALLNLVNAYTRNSQVLECIWSLYCQDLDKTASNQGLYGIAARINSIGLRLIMDQIPAELTLDVLLRSLLGWDGLPCNKMFTKCRPESAAMTLLAATSGKKP